ncbi:hypothetical protein ACHWQZ_G011453 [Mnemiopsis leidyi]
MTSQLENEPTIMESGSHPGGRSATVEDVLDEIQREKSWRGLIIVALLLTTHASTAYVINYPNFGGFIPYTSWRCQENSTVCTERVGQYSKENPDKSPYNSDVLCGKYGDNPAMTVKTDFIWDLPDGRNTYAIEWDIYCGTEFKGTLLSSLYFVGGFVGLLVGSFTYDTLGRRTTLIPGYSVVAACMLAAAVAPNIGVMMAIRVVMGIGSFMGVSGLYVYIIENTCSKWRGLVSSFIATCWGLGTGAVLPVFGYFITGWRWLSAAGGFLMFGSVLCWFIVPNSPRQLMENNNNQLAATKSLKRMAKLLGRKFDAKNTELIRSKKEAVAHSSYLDTLKEFLRYPELRIQVVIQMHQWVIVAFLYYGFTFSWSKLGKNIYLGYMFSGISEILAALLCWFGQDVFGRRTTLVSLYLAGGASFLLALVPLSFGSQNVLTMEQLMCLIGAMAVSGAWGTNYLYVAEQSPTNQRGKISAVCSIAARLGSFAGPQASLLFTWNKTATLVFFSVLAISAGLIALRLPETKGRQSPNSAQEVQERRRNSLERRRGEISASS